VEQPGTRLREDKAYFVVLGVGSGSFETSFGGIREGKKREGKKKK
jgi:hypothetical protein